MSDLRPVPPNRPRSLSRSTLELRSTTTSRDAAKGGGGVAEMKCSGVCGSSDLKAACEVSWEVVRS